MNISVHSFNSRRSLPWPQIRWAIIIAGISILFCTAGNGQSDQPTANLTPSSTINGPSAEVTFADGKSLALRSKNGRFALVATSANAVVNIQFRISLAANGIAAAQCLDGGTLSTGAEKIALDADGSGSFQFRAGAKPGLYRVFLGTGSATANLQFWVIDANNPNSNPSALRAQ